MKHMEIEAKRVRKEEDVQRRNVKRLATEEPRTAEWFERVFAKFKKSYKHVQSRHGTGYVPISDANQLATCINYTSLRINSLTPAVTDDFSYLAVFRNLIDVSIYHNDAPEEGEGETLIPFTLNGGHLDQTTIQKLFIQSKYHVLTNISPAFAASLGNITMLSLECTIRLSNPAVAMKAPRLSDMALGTGHDNLEHRRLDHYQSSFTVGWFSKLPALHTLQIDNVVNAVNHVVSIGGKATDTVRVSYCNIESVPSTWATAMPNLEFLGLTHTKMGNFNIEHFHPFASLKTLEIGNFDFDQDDVFLYDYEKEDRESFASRFGEAGVHLYGMPSLERITFDNVGVGILYLGKGEGDNVANVARDKLPLASLKDIRVTPACNMYLANEGDTAPSFVPALKYVELPEDVMWEMNTEEEEREGYADWYESAGVVLPLFLLGAYTLQSYDGTMRMDIESDDGVATIDLDEYLGAGAVLPNNFRTTPYFTIFLTSICRINYKKVRLTSSSRASLKDALDETYVAIRAERLAAKEAKRQRILEAARAKERAKERAAVFEQLVTFLPAELQGEARRKYSEREKVPLHRVVPYFTRYDPDVKCADGSDLPSPFAAASTPTGMRYPICSICREPFNRAYHDADPDPILDNIFLERRNELEVAAQQSATGCVVVCNVLPSDFDANNYTVPVNRTHQQAVEQIQCDHHRHFFHRVCYATTLFDMFSINGNTFQCPETRFQFH